MAYRYFRVVRRSEIPLYLMHIDFLDPRVTWSAIVVRIVIQHQTAPVGGAPGVLANACLAGLHKLDRTTARTPASSPQHLHRT